MYQFPIVYTYNSQHQFMGDQSKKALRTRLQLNRMKEHALD